MSDTAPPAPSRPLADTSATDRIHYRRGVRYGIALVAVLLGVFHIMTWNPSALVHVVDPLFAAQTILLLLLGIGLLAGGLAIAPTSLLRALPAAALAIAAVTLTAVLLYLRLTGGLRGGSPFLWTVLSPGTAALASGLLGWLIVRDRHPLTWLVVLGALIPGVVRSRLVLAGVDHGLIWFTDLLLTAGVGVVAAWLAYAASILLGSRSSGRSGPG